MTIWKRLDGQTPKVQPDGKWFLCVTHNQRVNEATWKAGVLPYLICPVGDMDCVFEGVRYVEAAE